MKQHKVYGLMAASMMISLLVAGCSSDKDNNRTPDPVVAVAVGTEDCLRCHEYLNPTFISDYLQSVHSGQDVVRARSLANSLSRMRSFDPATVLVGCEDCHGLGSLHVDAQGDVEIGQEHPDFNICGGCHTDLLEQYTSSAHALPGVPEEELQEELRNEAKCVKCHNDEGARAYKDVVTYAELAATTPMEDEVSVIQCRTCHNPHNPNEFLKDSSGSGSAQYNTCTNCHQAYDAEVTTDVTDATTSDGQNGDLIYHGKRWDRVIATTHYDDPATTGHGTSPSPGKIEGYTMDPDDADVCAKCHNVHSADLTINEQWAASGHGGEIIDIKEAAAAGATNKTLAQVLAVKSAYANGDDSTWAHYNWDDTASRAGCQRCHTATGFSHYADDPASYTTAMNTFPNLVEWSASGGSAQNELLYCWGCHTSVATGELRDPGAITVRNTSNPAVTVTFDGAAVILPDVGKSNVCYSCHSGAGNMQSTFTTRIPTHHAVAAATLNADVTHIGWEFFDSSFYQVPFFEHNEINFDDAVEDEDGPCVSCHMADDDHHFAAVDEAAGTIKAQALCNECHTVGGPYEMTYAKLEEEKAGYLEAGALLNAYVTNTITNHLDSNISGTAPASGNDRGAWYNWKFLPTEDPGGFVHNRFYVKCLLFDSIDWLSDGDFDGTITIPADYPEARAWFGADANGVATRPIDPPDA